MTDEIKKLNSELIASIKHLKFYKDEFCYLEEPNKKFEIAALRHPGAVVILPILNDGRLQLIFQHRYVLNQKIYEFPAGTLGLNEDPLVCAQREIREETGFRANSWTDLGQLWPAPGFCDELQYLFVAKNLEADPLPGDEDERIELVSKTVDEVDAMIVSGELRDAKSISIFYKARLLKLI